MGHGSADGPTAADRLLNALVDERRRQHLTQMDMAEAMGVPQSSVSTFERLSSKQGGGPVVTDDQITALRLYSEGYSRAQIAARLGVSTPSIDNYLRQIRDELGVSTTIEAVVEAVYRDWI